MAQDSGLNGHIAIRNSWPLISGNPIPYLNALRDRRNALAAEQPSKAAWPRGKLQLARFAAQNGASIPRIVAVMAEGQVAAGPCPTGSDAAALLTALPHGSYFCKRVHGGNGVGAFRLGITPGGITVDGCDASAESVATRFSTRAYIVQEWLTPMQHEDMARFNRATINTLRLVTVDNGGITPISAVVRIAIDSTAVDNWAAGGVAVPVGLEEGALHARGVLKENKTVVQAHPCSGEKFAGRRIPHFAAAVAMARRLHGRLAFASVGWDIALLKNGPYLLEANRQWDLYLSAQLDEEFIGRFLRLHLSPATEARRVQFAGSFLKRNALLMWLCAALGRAGVSAKIEELSTGRLTVAFAGGAREVEAAAAALARLARQFGFDAVRRTQYAGERLWGFEASAALG